MRSLDGNLIRRLAAWLGTMVLSSQNSRLSDESSVCLSTHPFFLPSFLPSLLSSFSLFFFLSSLSLSPSGGEEDASGKQVNA